QGRYHNTRFKALAEALGITVSNTTTLGWSTTAVPDATAEAYRPELTQLAAALTAYRHREPGSGGRTGGRRSSNNNGVTAQCDCGRRIRTAPSTLAAGPINCGLCDHEFTA
ncbi:MAG: hypothetical protein ACRDRL_17410, partial [Sciscionella sp.]